MPLDRVVPVQVFTEVKYSAFVDYPFIAGVILMVRVKSDPLVLDIVESHAKVEKRVVRVLLESPLP